SRSSVEICYCLELSRKIELIIDQHKLVGNISATASHAFGPIEGSIFVVFGKENIITSNGKQRKTSGRRVEVSRLCKISGYIKISCLIYLYRLACIVGSAANAMCPDNRS